MCGISGFIGGEYKHLDVQKVGMLTEHRGPDNLGIYETTNVKLLHNRLSVIDLSEGANQPMVSVDSRYVIVFNGEIYNYLELKELLVSSYDVKFETNSDTEVLLYGFKYWGLESLLDKLDGMFAFAIWDCKEEVLTFARDHVGIKPLYYMQTSSGLCFSSELKTIEETHNDLEIDFSAVTEYLTYNYIPAPKSIFHGVCKLEPGYYGQYYYNTLSLKKTNWWKVPKTDYLDIPYEEAVRLVKDEVSKSIKDQLVADVPVGAFLSGGVDSSIIAAEIAECHNNVNVYSIGYANNQEFDETLHAKRVAEKFGLNHHIIYPSVEDDSVLRMVDDILSQVDEPYGNPTVAMTNIICERARNEVVVGLVGDGGDEVFGGYPRYRALNLAERYQSINRIVSKFATPVLNRLPETPKGNHFVRRAKQFLSNADKPIESMFQDWSAIMSSSELFEVLHPKIKTHSPEARMNFLEELFMSNDGAAADNACFSDLSSFLPYNLLEGADRMSMKQSFELRVPFVSRRLVELSMSLKPDWKIKGGVTKRILKDAYKGILPDSILHRKKRGFNPPVWNWLQDNELFVRGYLNSDSKISHLFVPGYIDNQVSDFYTLRKDNSSHIWSMIVLERWFERRKVNMNDI